MEHGDGSSGQAHPPTPEESRRIQITGERIGPIAVAVLLLAAIVRHLPILFPGWFTSWFPESSPAGISTLMERGTSLLAALTSLGLILLWLRLRSSKAPSGHKRSRKKGEGRSTARSRPDWIRILMILSMSLPLLIQTWIYTTDSYRSLYLGDMDFTNISEALNRTAKGDFPLTTPFVATGSRGSFLGHHLSPSLFLFVPMYAMEQPLFRLEKKWDSLLGRDPPSRPTHLIYGRLLVLALGMGAILWSLLIDKTIRDSTVAVSLSFLLWNSVPMDRIAASFHFEILVLPASALLFLAQRKNNLWMLLLSLFFWLGIKEDMAVYLAIYGFSLLLSPYLDWNRKEKNRTLSPGLEGDREKDPFSARSWLLPGVSILWFLLAMGPLALYFTGHMGSRWSAYWESPGGIRGNFSVLYLMLLSFAFLPLLRPYSFFSIILPIFLIHFVSDQPWHATLYGHYSYTILPFLMLLSLEAASRLEAGAHGGSLLRMGAILFALSLSLYAAAGEKETPPVSSPPEVRFPVVEAWLQNVPPGSCLQTQIPFTPHAPLDLRILPLIIPAENPVRTKGGLLTAEGGDLADGFCENYFLFIDENDPRPPYYQGEEIRRFVRNADRYLIRIATSGSLSLYARK